MGELVLIRHGKPRKDPSIEPSAWELAATETPKLERLAQSLRPLSLTRLVTSEEPKAIQTGAILASELGISVGTDARLNEVARGAIHDDADFMAAANAYLGGELVLGWEHQRVVVARLEAAVAATDEEGLVGFVTHGTAMSTLLGSRGLVDPRRFWGELQTPDAWVVKGAELHRLER